MGEPPFTDAEMEYLQTAANPRGWYEYSENARPMIDGFVERHFMAATGAFSMRETPQAAPVELLGVSLPVVGTMISFYQLTRLGRAVLAEQHGSNRNG